MEISREAVDAAISTVRDRFEYLAKPDYITIDDEHQVVGFSFPESDGLDYDFDEVLRAASELGKTRIDLSAGRLVTPSCYYQLVESDSYKSYRFLESQPPAILADGIEIGIRRCPLQVALAALEHNAWVRHVWPPDGYTAVELIAAARPIDEQRARELIESYLFELAATADVTFVQTEFFVESDAYSMDEDEEPLDVAGLMLESHNEGMRLYLAAVQISDPELELLSLYKVLEYFAPVAVGLEATDAMRRRLDAGRTQIHDGAFIQSIFELARSFEARRTDKEMMVSVFAASVDIVRLASLLPTPIRPRISDLSKRAEIGAASRAAAEVLVATRNQVAHAKANYAPTGKEIRREDLAQFNQFVRTAAESAIRWYNRLPPHQRSLTGNDTGSPPPGGE